ncbi:MAG TPA: flagellar motor switch protein FliN [Chloroflexi bacterium]|jgi:flagellar motor switch protein FliN/FliY|nr:flagellar motor switch protein FliN [Chloroflexota bacterium]
MIPDDDIILSDDELEQLLSQGVDETPDEELEPGPVGAPDAGPAFVDGYDETYEDEPEIEAEPADLLTTQADAADESAGAQAPAATLQRESAVRRPNNGETVQVQPVQFSPLPPVGSATTARSSELAMLYDVPLQITVELGRTHMSVREVLRMGPGAVVELERSAGELVDILVNGVLFAQGEVVVVDEQFGVRITRLVGRDNDDPSVDLPTRKGR